MNRPPAFLFYVKDWLTSKKRATMTLEQQAAYINLLSHCWDSDDCSLPNEEAELAALSELRERWSTEGSKVKLCFAVHPIKPNRLFNEKLSAIWKELRAFRQAKSRAGQKGMASRWKHTRNGHGADNNTVITELLQSYYRVITEL